MGMGEAAPRGGEPDGADAGSLFAGRLARADELLARLDTVGLTCDLIEIPALEL